MCVGPLCQRIGFQKSQIELAIISTYALQLSWVYSFFAPSTPVVLVTQPAPSENGNATIKEVLPNWIRVTPFLRGGRGVMHMKVHVQLTLLVNVETHRSSSSYCFIDQGDYASLSRPLISWIMTGGTLKTPSGSRIYLAGSPLFRTDQQPTTSLRPLKESCMRSTSRPPSPVLSQLMCVVPTCNTVSPLVPLMRCFQAPRHPAQCYTRRCTSHALGLLSRTRNPHSEYCREARGVARRRQVRSYSPHARRQPTKPTTAGRLARMPGGSIMSESARAVTQPGSRPTGILNRRVQCRLAR
jgi:hypothetical protein